MKPDNDEAYQQWLADRRITPTNSIRDSVMAAIDDIESASAEGGRDGHVLANVDRQIPGAWRHVRWTVQIAHQLAVASALLLGIIRLTLMLLPFSELR